MCGNLILHVYAVIEHYRKKKWRSPSSKKKASYAEAKLYLIINILSLMAPVIMAF